MSYGEHISVLRDEVVHYLTENIKQGDNCNFADLTFGGGGHTFTLAKEVENCEIYSTDQDPHAFSNGKKNIKEHGFDDRIHLLHMNFSEFPDYLLKHHSDLRFNGILMDLGVSSHQFDEKERGFSFRADAKLDMRMNYTDDEIKTAADIVNEYDEEGLADIFFKYGEERYSKRIAKKIIEERSKDRIETTTELENIIFHCYPKASRFKGTHPATRCFQALRIEVNRELEVLENSIGELVDALCVGGRFAIISFHSLEDRIVKHTFKKLSKERDDLQILTKKPLIPKKEEIERNSRSRSAKLRVVEKIDPRTKDDKKKNKYKYKNKSKER